MLYCNLTICQALSLTVECGDIAYYKYTPRMLFDITNTLEQTEFTDTLGVASAGKGANRETIYKELGWETL